MRPWVLMVRPLGLVVKTWNSMAALVILRRLARLLVVPRRAETTALILLFPGYLRIQSTSRLFADEVW